MYLVLLMAFFQLAKIQSVNRSHVDLKTILQPFQKDEKSSVGNILGILLNSLSFSGTGTQIGYPEAGLIARDLLRKWSKCGSYVVGAVFPEMSQQTKLQQKQEMLQAREMLAEFRPRVKMLRAQNTGHFVHQFSNRSLDFVLLHDQYSYCNTIEVLQQYWEKVRPGGIIAGFPYSDTTSLQSHNIVESLSNCSEQSHEGAAKGAVDDFFSWVQKSFSRTKYETSDIIVHKVNGSVSSQNISNVKCVWIVQKPISRPSHVELKNFKHRDLLGALLEEEGHHVGAEIGISQGVFASRTLRQWPSCSRYYAIDLWKHQKNYKEAGNKPNSMMEVYFRRSVQNMAPYGEKVKVMRMLSSEAAKKIADNELDYIYIDARHDYCGVKEDLDNYIPKVKSGGIVAGHDYMDAERFANISNHLEDWSLCGNGTVHPGAVKGAVDEAVASLGVELFVLHKDGPFPSWLFRKP